MVSLWNTFERCRCKLFYFVCDDCRFSIFFTAELFYSMHVFVLSCLFVCLFAVLNTSRIFSRCSSKSFSFAFIIRIYALSYFKKKRMLALFYYFAFAKWMMASYHTNVWISDEQFPTECRCLFFLLWVTRNNHLFSYDSLCRFFLVCLSTEYQERSISSCLTMNLFQLTLFCVKKGRLVYFLQPPIVFDFPGPKGVAICWIFYLMPLGLNHLKPSAIFIFCSSVMAICCYIVFSHLVGTLLYFLSPSPWFSFVPSTPIYNNN